MDRSPLPVEARPKIAMSANSVILPDHRIDPSGIARLGDLVMFLALLCEGTATIAIGYYFDELNLALLGTGAILLLASAVFAAARGRDLCWVVLTTCNVGFVALQIQLGHGTPEFHFGAFVLLGLLLVYRDWRPIVLTAGLIALHHAVVDRLQAMGYGVFCTTEAGFLRVLVHAAYVIVQTGAEVYIAVHLRRRAVEASELSAIVKRIDRDGALCLDVADISVSAPIALMLKAAVSRMERAMDDVSAAARSIETSSLEIASGNLDLSRRTEGQASNLQQTAASMEQLTSAVANTAETARAADAIAGAASQAAAAGGNAVNRVVAIMGDISDSSRRIADHIGVIDAIAFQTNLLALNAAVEAARAGTLGSGFAVVAGEVRMLARRSAEAAKQIKVLIAESVERVAAGQQLVSAAGGSMAHIVDQAHRVGGLIATISNAAGRQTIDINQVGAAVVRLDQATQQNAALVEQSAAAAESLKDQAVRLNSVVGQFTLAARPARMQP